MTERPVLGGDATCHCHHCSQLFRYATCVRVCGAVNAVNAGQGDLEITVNGGTVPCTVQPRGNRLLHASFTPRVAVPHDVEVKFNGQEITGLPVFRSRLKSRFMRFSVLLLTAYFICLSINWRVAR